ADVKRKESKRHSRHATCRLQNKEDWSNVLIQEEMNFKKNEMEAEHTSLYSKMTDEQKEVYNTIMEAINSGKGGVFFLYGYGGTCKTFVWKTLSSAIRSKGEVVLNVASSRISALLLPRGRTAHSRFRIPINVNEQSFCNISADSPLAALLRKTKLIIWDEAPMTHKHAFEALDRTLRDVIDTNSSDKPFGGKTILFGGDFRQVLPVIQKGTREQIVDASLNHSYIWEHCTVLKLTTNMRLKSTNNEEDTKELKEFADWMLKIGEGEVGPENDGEVEIKFPNDVLIKTDGDTLKAMVEAIYPTIDEEIGKHGYFENKAILVPTNEEVDLINEHMLSQINEKEKVYLSSDTICQTEINGSYNESIYSPELLNAFKISGLPNHCLKLKKGVPVMILRNIDQQNGLCNGTRLIITGLEDHVIEGKIISGTNIGKYTYIPRLQLMPLDKRIPFKFNRRQFPLMVCFAMTINKSQVVAKYRPWMPIRSVVVPEIKTNYFDWSCSDESPARHSIIYRGLVPVSIAESARASHDESTEKATELALQHTKEKQLCKTVDAVVALHRAGTVSIILK
ncbi:ATP-dependent DNA helicase PIF1-like protein, partial [Tanacetum coccineum]